SQALARTRSGCAISKASRPSNAPADGRPIHGAARTRSLSSARASTVLPRGLTVHGSAEWTGLQGQPADDRKPQTNHQKGDRQRQVERGVRLNVLEPPRVSPVLEAGEQQRERAEAGKRQTHVSHALQRRERVAAEQSELLHDLEDRESEGHHREAGTNPSHEGPLGGETGPIQRENVAKPEFWFLHRSLPSCDPRR